MKPVPDIDMFVVRVWRNAPAFRATARRVDADETAVFESAEQLARFLAGVAATGKASATAKTRARRRPRQP